MNYKNLWLSLWKAFKAFKGNWELLKKEIADRLARLIAPRPSSVHTRNEYPTEENKNYAEVHEELFSFLKSRFVFRYNVLTEQVEYKKKNSENSDEPFLRIDHRTRNTLVIQARKEGIPCWDKDLDRLLQSHYIDSFHPIRNYMDQLPAWDGTDRITPLAERVDSSPIWINGFRRWLLALCAQWMGQANLCANTLIPLLISPRQGLGKSTFCRLLMPPELQAYYLDKFDLNAKVQAEIKLGQFGLINLDEFDRYSHTALATLKNLVQLKQPTVKKAYASYFVQLDRMASFIGTSNQLELLNDPSGSRRFLCVEVKHPINRSPIDHAQLFAQLKQLILQGERNWMDRQEEKILQFHNQLFTCQRPELEVFYRLYTIPTHNEKPQMYTTTEIHRSLCLANPSAMRGINVLQLGKTLSALGLRRIHTKVGNKYAVVRKESDEVQ